MGGAAPTPYSPRQNAIFAERSPRQIGLNEGSRFDDRPPRQNAIFAFRYNRIWMSWMNKCRTDNGAGQVLGGAAPAARILHVRMRFSPSVLSTSELDRNEG